MPNESVWTVNLISLGIKRVSSGKDQAVNQFVAMI